MRSVTAATLLVLVFVGVNLGVGQEAPVEQPAAQSIPAVIALEVTIAEGPAAALKLDQPATRLLESVGTLSAEGRLTHHTRMIISALSQQKVMMQMGEEVAVVDGKQTIPSRGGVPYPVARSYSRQNIGTLMQCTVDVQDGRIVGEFTVEQSRLQPSADARDDADAPPVKRLLTTRTAVRVDDGGAVVLGGSTEGTGDAARQTVVIATARIVSPGRAAAR